MERRDYILRLIAQLARVLARVRELLERGAVAEARAELERASAGLGLSGPLLQALNDQTLLSLLSVGGGPDTPKRVLVAESFATAALAARARGDEPEAQRLLARALALYRSVAAETEALAGLGVEGRPREIEGMLGE